MALKDIWQDLENAVQGIPDSGDNADAETINEIAHAVISLEEKPDPDEQKIADEVIKQLHETPFDVANALRETANGEIIRVDDVSPIKHLATATVKSKNLLNASDLVNNQFVQNIDGSFTFTKGSDRYSREIVLDAPIPANTFVTFSVGSYNGTASSFSLQVLSADRQKSNTTSLSSTVLSRQFSSNFEVARVRLFFSSALEDGAYVNLTDIQLELGTIATEYTPKIDPTTVSVTRYGVDETDKPKTYEPEADCTFEIEPLSPTMTLVTDTNGAIIDLEYNQDANAFKANVKSEIEQLKYAIIELGGNV